MKDFQSDVVINFLMLAVEGPPLSVVLGRLLCLAVGGALHKLHPSSEVGVTSF